MFSGEDLKKEVTTGGWKMAARKVGTESTSPYAQVKHLVDLLRNRANSQRYSSMYEDWKPKTVEDIDE